MSVNNCSSQGVCIEANFCKCDMGYTGADCANASCEALNYCSGESFLMYLEDYYKADAKKDASSSDLIV